MTDARKDLTDLELKRLELEKQIADLQTSIYHWRLWNAEYDGLKEELSSLPENSTREDILQIGSKFDGSQVTEKEVRALLGEGSPGPPISRSPQQIIRAIDRRIDYVLDNIKALEKRTTALEDKLKTLIVEQPDNGLNEEGLPITDIVEELDEDGNIISSSTTMPGKETNELLNVLKKAGLGVPTGKAKNEQTTTEFKATDAPLPLTSANDVTEKKLVPDTATSKPIQPSQSEVKIQDRKEIINQKVDIPAKEDQNPLPSNDSAIQSVTPSPESAINTANDVEKDLSVIAEVQGDSPEDAALRREMLQYGLEEVGAIVAELELDEDGSEFSVDDEDYDLDEDSEEEDEYGRSTRKILDNDYIEQMRELEKKLNAKSLQNIGPDTSSLPSEVRTQIEQGPSAMKKGPAKKKTVAFAAELDIAPEPSPKPAPITNAKIEGLPPPIQEAVVERSEATNTVKIQDPGPARKTSRFKRARNSESSTSQDVTAQSIPRPPINGSSLNSRAPVIPPPLFPATPSTPKPFSQPISDVDKLPLMDSNEKGANGPKPNNKPLADVLVERTVHRDSVIPPGPDELDESIHRREVAAEFYKLRNHKIQQSGGFLQEDAAEPLVPLSTDEKSQTGQEKPKKVSRFKAARAKVT